MLLKLSSVNPAGKIKPKRDSGCLTRMPAFLRNERAKEQTACVHSILLSKSTEIRLIAGWGIRDKCTEQGHEPGSALNGLADLDGLAALEDPNPNKSLYKTSA